MFHVVGVRVAAIRSATPVPLSATGEPVTGTLAKIVNVPVTAPSAVGVNTTLMVQVAPAAKVAVQVLLAASEKTADEKTASIPLAAPVPVLCSVRVRAAVGKPMPALPKASGPPVTLSIATGAAEPTSIAPGSKNPVSPGSGLRLPK